MRGILLLLSACAIGLIIATLAGAVAFNVALLLAPWVAMIAVLVVGSAGTASRRRSFQLRGTGDEDRCNPAAASPSAK